MGKPPAITLNSTYHRTERNRHVIDVAMRAVTQGLFPKCAESCLFGECASEQVQDVSLAGEIPHSPNKNRFAPMMINTSRVSVGF